MFTGLIDRIGKLEAVRNERGGRVLTVSHDPWETPVELGESVSVQGVCLTAREVRDDIFICDVLDETLASSNLGSMRIGSLLNLERALRAGDRLGGHIVSGHVDGVGKLVLTRAVGRDRVLRVRCEEALIDGLLVLKGSVACDGVSLTVSDLGDTWFEVNVIPHTLDHTTLRDTAEGDTVNIETDVLGKYIRAGLPGSEGGGSVTWEKLRSAGFLS